MTRRYRPRIRVYGRVPRLPCGCSMPCLLVLLLAVAAAATVAWLLI